jgi:hypothetical protein
VYRDVSRIVTDQNTHRIVVAGQQLSEGFTYGGSNGLNLPLPTPESGDTNDEGIFGDHLYDCSSLCPASTATTNITQTITDVFGGTTYTLTPNLLVYACGNITVDGN